MVEVAKMDELMAVHIHSNNLATFPDPEATPELIAKVEEIKEHYGLRDLRPAVWGIEEETPKPDPDTAPQLGTHAGLGSPCRHTLGVTERARKR